MASKRISLYHAREMSNKHTNVVGIIPLQADLQIMTIGNEIMKLLQHICALFAIQAIDLKRERSYSTQ